MVAEIQGRPLPTPAEVAAAQPWRNWGRFMALGDSLTEGLWDCTDTDREHVAGWADRYAAALSAKREAAGLEPVEYANLAIRGRLLRQIVDEQIPVALEEKPDIVSLIAGANDFLRPRFEIDPLIDLLDQTIARLRAAGIDVILSTHGDSKGSPIVSLSRSRAMEWSLVQWSLARKHGCYIMDMWPVKFLRYRNAWGFDHLHPNELGHRALAAAAAYCTGVSDDDPSQWEIPAGWQPFGLDRQDDARWLKEDVFPWVGRRIRGTSSGMHRSAKRPRFEVMPGDASAIAYRASLPEAAASEPQPRQKPGKSAK